MRIMIDTNVIISSALFPHGRTAQALYKALQPPCIPVLCDYVIDEVHRKILEKWPHRQMEMESFLFQITQCIEVVSAPSEKIESELLIRDPKDRPILRAALDAHADLFLTGDKDFLESAIIDPRIVSPADFLTESY